MPTAPIAQHRSDPEWHAQKSPRAVDKWTPRGNQRPMGNAVISAVGLAA